ncbi:hypothetical protein GBF38_012314 [Nibea albiflora]|uniref:Uncharacterized protein n=1 Tax=Nibea albiflora TaxID=240163 RepID=A0ACB7EMC9_NIBAL|nr:hypothetical protein GBF38_012314 [Nibea albiflora]
MAFLSLFMRRQLSPAVSHFARIAKLVRPPCAGAPLRRLHGSARLRVAEKGPWGKSRGPEQQYQLTYLDKADALVAVYFWLCFAGFLSWFRNGLLATGIGVIAFVQSEVGREAGYGTGSNTNCFMYKPPAHIEPKKLYAFFILGGVCVSFGGASYIGSLFALRRMMLLSVPALLIQSAAVGTVALFWLCAISLYIGRLEVEIIHEDEEGEDEEECRECRERREHRGYHGSHDSRHQDSEDNGGKGPNK